MQISRPTAEQNLIYSRESITGVKGGEGYSLSGDTAINAGNYTATAELDSNYA